MRTVSGSPVASGSNGSSTMPSNTPLHLTGRGTRSMPSNRRMLACEAKHDSSVVGTWSAAHSRSRARYGQYGSNRSCSLRRLGSRDDQGVGRTRPQLVEPAVALLDQRRDLLRARNLLDRVELELDPGAVGAQGRPSKLVLGIDERRVRHVVDQRDGDRMTIRTTWPTPRDNGSPRSITTCNACRLRVLPSRHGDDSGQAAIGWRTVRVASTAWSRAAISSRWRVRRPRWWRPWIELSRASHPVRDLRRASGRRRGAAPRPRAARRAAPQAPLARSRRGRDRSGDVEAGSRTVSVGVRRLARR